MKNKETGEDIVLDLENDAENAEQHDHCEIYRQLYTVLLEKVGEKSAIEVMKAIRDECNGFLPRQ